MKYTDPSGQVYATDEGLNDDGELWYCIYSDEGHANLIGIVTGADNLAAMYPTNLDLAYDKQAETSQLNTLAYQIAENNSNKSRMSREYEFFGGADCGISSPVVSNNKSNPVLTALAWIFVTGAAFGDDEGGFGFGGGGADAEYGTTSLLTASSKQAALNAVTDLPENIRSSATDFIKNRTGLCEDFSVVKDTDGNYIMQATKAGNNPGWSSIYWQYNGSNGEPITGGHWGYDANGILNHDHVFFGIKP